MISQQGLGRARPVVLGEAPPGGRAPIHQRLAECIQEPRARRVIAKRIPGAPHEVRVTFRDPGGPLHGVGVEAAAATRAEIEIPAPLHSFHVSPGGSGSACTWENPCALGEGLSLAQAGDEIVLRGGVYYEGEFTVPRSGSPGAPIVVRGHPGERAVFDGAEGAGSILENVTVTGGYAWDGGGLYTHEAGSLDLADCLIADNTATGGAGVYIQGPAASSLLRVRFERNVATGSGGTAAGVELGKLATFALMGHKDYQEMVGEIQKTTVADDRCLV